MAARHLRPLGASVVEAADAPAAAGLRAVHDRIVAEGSFVSHARRVLIEARNPS